MPQSSVQGLYSPRVLYRPTRLLPGRIENLQDRWILDQNLDRDVLDVYHGRLDSVSGPFLMLAEQRLFG
jgi:hypothetical protein